MLFGSVLGVKTGDIIAVTVVTVVVVIIVVMAYRKMVFATFDPDVAEVTGVQVQWVEALLMVMLSLTILVTMRVIGTLLISAMLVIPASVSRMTTNSIARMLWVSPIIGASSGFIGMNMAYHLDTSVSATIILVAAAMFAAVYGATGVRGRVRISALHHV